VLQEKAPLAVVTLGRGEMLNLHALCFSNSATGAAPKHRQAHAHHFDPMMPIPVMGVGRRSVARPAAVQTAVFDRRRGFPSGSVVFHTS
jgi:hypothetical protein